MNHFKTIHTILSILEEALDEPDADKRQLTAEALNITESRRQAYLEMLSDAGYIKGVEIRQYRGGTARVSVEDAQITLKGLEYLADYFDAAKRRPE